MCKRAQFAVTFFLTVDIRKYYFSILLYVLVNIRRRVIYICVGKDLRCNGNKILTLRWKRKGWPRVDEKICTNRVEWATLVVLISLRNLKLPNFSSLNSKIYLYCIWASKIHIFWFLRKSSKIQFDCYNLAHFFNLAQISKSQFHY